MTEPAASDPVTVGMPRLPIAALEELRQVISSCLSSLHSEIPEGERDATKSVIRRGARVTRAKTARRGTKGSGGVVAPVDAVAGEDDRSGGQR